MKLYPFQQQEKNRIRKIFSEGKDVCLAWYTGAGKTNLFLTLAIDIIAEDKDALIGISSYLTNEIRDQTFKRLDSIGGGRLGATVEGASQDLPDKNILIFNPQSFYKRKLKRKFKLFIIDEGHVGLDNYSTMLDSIIKNCCDKNTRILIASATPWDLLSQKRFKDIVVLKRTMDQGLEDGQIQNYSIHMEQANVEFKREDFSVSGDLTDKPTMYQLIKSTSMGKFKNILSRHDGTIGDKCIVICPPGNQSEIAKALAKDYGLSYTQQVGGRYMSSRSAPQRKNLELENFNKFKTDKETRFLFVTNKCQVGFDMPHLDSIIDLTMTRNLKLLAQRLGRVARKNGNQKKHYFYVYDKSLMANDAEWLISTLIDFSLGHYDGWRTENARSRSAIPVGSAGEECVTYELESVVKALKHRRAIDTKFSMPVLRRTDASDIYRWSLPLAIEAAKKYESRTEMWAKQPALYKWFRQNAKDTMDAIFPKKYSKWTLDKALAAAELCTSRQAFHSKFSGAAAFLRDNDLSHKLHEIIPESVSRKRTDDEIKKAIASCKTWGELRRNYPGIRHRFAKQAGGTKRLIAIWKKVHGTEPRKWTHRKDGKRPRQQERRLR